MIRYLRHNLKEVALIMKIYVVDLTAEESEHISQILSSGEEKVRKLARAQILRLADKGWSDQQISEAVGVSVPTVERTRKRFVQEGFEVALNGRPRQPRSKRKIDGRVEAHLIALACSPPPAGHQRWTLRLLAEKLVTLEAVDLESVSHETVRQVLKKTNSSLGSANRG